MARPLIALAVAFGVVLAAAAALLYSSDLPPQQAAVDTPAADTGVGVTSADPDPSRAPDGVAQPSSSLTEEAASGRPSPPATEPARATAEEEAERADAAAGELAAASPRVTEPAAAPAAGEAEGTDAPAGELTVAPPTRTEPATTPAPGEAEGTSAPAGELAAAAPAATADGGEPDPAALPTGAPAAEEPSRDGTAEVLPSFEIARVEATGEPVLSGRAAPGSEVEITLGDEIIATATADAQGQFLARPEIALEPGSHELSVRVAGSAEPAGSEQRVAIIVPEGGPGEPEGSEIAELGPTGAPAAEEPSRDGTAEVLPSFEIARVEATGEPVLSGRAAPGSEVEITLGDEIIATATADAQGQFLARPEIALEPGSHELSVRVAGSAEPAGSEQRVAIIVPERGPGEPKGSEIAEPGPDAVPALDDTAASADAGEEQERTPSEVAPALPLSVAELSVSASEAGTAEVDSAPEIAAAVPLELAELSVRAAEPDAGVAVAPDVAAAAPLERIAEFAVVAEPDAARNVAAPRLAAAAPLQPADLSVRAVEPGGASIAAAPELAAAAPSPILALSVRASEASTDTAVAPELAAIAAPQTLDLAVGAAQPEATGPVAVRARAALEFPEQVGDLSIRAAEVEADTLYVAGEAAPGTVLRVFADEELVGEVQASGNGAWLVEAQKQVPVGQVVIRADAVDEGSGVPTAQLEMPFTRFAEGVALAPVMAAGEGGGESAVATGSVPQPAFVIIRRGDNLWRISRRNYGRGIRYKSIFAANRDRIRNPHRIYPGQVFIVPTHDRSWEGEPH